jgi:hypothetical protein
MSVACTQTADALAPAEAGNAADGSVVGQSCGPVEHADAPSIDQSTQCPGPCCTSTHAAYGWPGQTACWPLQLTPPSPTGDPPLLLQCTFAPSANINRQEVPDKRMGGERRASVIDAQFQSL